MKIIKRRAAGGHKLHFLEGRPGAHKLRALCGHLPADSAASKFKARAGWRNPFPHLPEPTAVHADAADCPTCVSRFIAQGGQFA